MRIADLAPGDIARLAALFAEPERARFEQAFAWRFQQVPQPLDALAMDERATAFIAAQPLPLFAQWKNVAAVQLGGGALARYSSDESVNQALLSQLLTQLRATPVALALAVVEPERAPLYERYGFRKLFDASARNLYLGLDAVSPSLSQRALGPVRAFAKEARRIRPKLIETPLNDATFEQLARLMASNRDHHPLTVDKSLAYLSWRYGKEPRYGYRLLTYRSKAGEPIAAFALVRRFNTHRGRHLLHLDTHWTRDPGRRAQAKLLGELALYGLTESADVLRCFAVEGSHTEQTLVSLGCIRKKLERTVLVARIAVDAPELASPLDPKQVSLDAGDLELYDS